MCRAGSDLMFEHAEHKHWTIFKNIENKFFISCCCTAFFGTFPLGQQLKAASLSSRHRVMARASEVWTFGAFGGLGGGGGRDSDGVWDAVACHRFYIDPTRKLTSFRLGHLKNSESGELSEFGHDFDHLKEWPFQADFRVWLLAVPPEFWTSKVAKQSAFQAGRLAVQLQPRGKPTPSLEIRYLLGTLIRALSGWASPVYVHSTSFNAFKPRMTKPEWPCVVVQPRWKEHSLGV